METDFQQGAGANFDIGEAVVSDGDAAENQNEVQKSEKNAKFEVRPGLAVENSIFDELLSARKLELLADPVRRRRSGGVVVAIKPFIIQALICQSALGYA